MVYHEEENSTKMGSFSRGFPDDSIYSNDIVPTRHKLPPDKSSKQFLAAGSYLWRLILWFVLLTSYNKTPFQCDKHDLAVIESNYNSQLSMNIAETFFPLATNYSNSFHSVQNYKFHDPVQNSNSQVLMNNAENS